MKLVMLRSTRVNGVDLGIGELIEISDPRLISRLLVSDTAEPADPAERRKAIAERERELEGTSWIRSWHQ